MTKIIEKIKIYIRYILVIKALHLTRTKELDNWILHREWIFTNVRGNGKTIAGMIWLIVYDYPLSKLFGVDVDYIPSLKQRYDWYNREYMKLLKICKSHWWWKVFWN